MIPLDQSLLIAGILLKYTPEVAASVAAIFEKKEVNLSDWTTVFDRAKTPFEKGLLPGVLIQPKPDQPTVAQMLEMIEKPAGAH